ncbi:hypothetical protein COLO4_06255 [Corchorus olitorius]|uniref:Uncharacterized protein n=1 Tax=Corchorus olitorius TaxID=93759 RepID=A0A1R3KNQ8_9ROSI|nr:hypothetical protein COLO4_06255 [Corchorus olitorius]
MANDEDSEQLSKKWCPILQNLYSREGWKQGKIWDKIQL